ncbi:MAG: hypothetical protein Q9222_003140 [Ikaeria aurantiellina]
MTVSSLPTTAHCFGITYHTDELSAAAAQDAKLPLGSIQGFPMAYPLSNMVFAWPDHGHPFAGTGYPWAAGCDTSSLQKFPLVPGSITGHNANGPAKPWDGSTSRSSDVGNGQEQSDFVFLDKTGKFCLIATETPLGQSGWLPCAW